MEKKKNGVGSVLTDDWESDLAAIIEKTNQNLNLLRKIGEKREEPKLTTPSGLLSRTRSSPLMMNSNANDYRATAESSSSSISKWKKVLDESTTMKRHIATKILDSTKTKSDAARGAWDATTLTNHDGQRETTKPTSFQPLVPMDDVRKSLEVDIAARAKTIENMVNDQRLDFKRLASECAASRAKTDEIVQMIDTKMQRLEAFEMDATKALESLPRVETQTIALLKWKGMVEYDMQSATLKLDSVVSAQDKWTRLERQVSDIELKLQRLPTMDDLVETLTKRVQELERQVSKSNADGHGIGHAVEVAVNKAMQTLDDRVTKRIDDATTMHDTKTASFVKTLNSQREHAEKSMQFALDASISDIHMEIDQVTKRMETRVHDLHVSNDTRVTTLTKRVAAVEVAVADVDSNPTSDITDEQLRKLQTRLDSCVTKQQVGAVVAEHIESSVGLRRVETSLAKTQQDHDRKLTEVRQELSTTQDDLARVHGTVASMQSAIHKTSSVENQVLRAKLLQSVTELDELHQVKHDMTAHFDRRSKEHDAAVAALTAQVAAADKKREDDVATLTKALTEKSVQVASTQGKLTGLQECWNRDVEQMQSTRASMLKAQRESADMRAALQKCQGDVARQNVEKQHLVDAIRRLTSQWTTARDEAVQAKGTLHQATQQHTGRVRLLESTIAKLQVVHASTMLKDATVSSSPSREVARLTSDLASTQVELQSVQEELQEVSASKLKVEAQLNTCLLQMQSGHRQDEIGRTAQAARQVALDNAQKKMKELMTREHDVATAVEALLTTLNMTRTPAVEPSTMVDTLQLIQNTVREWHTQKLVGADNAAMDKLQRLVDANQVELTAQQVAWEGKLQTYAGQLQAVLDQKADVEADLAQLKKQLELELARQQQVEVDAAAAIEAHIATERQLQDKVFELEAMVDAITSQKTSMESNLTALQATHMNATRDTRGTSDSVIASLKQKLEDAEAKHDDATQQAAALEAKLKGLQDSNKTLTDEYNSVCHVLDQCNVALNATEEDVKTLQFELTQAQYQVQEREAKLQTALAKIDCVTEDKDRAESTLLQLQTELATVQHAQVDAAKTDQSQLDQVRAKVDVLVQEKQAVEAKLLLVAAREEALQEERAQLKLQSDARELEVQSQVKTLTDALKVEQDATATREAELNALIEHIKAITTPSSNHAVKSNGDGNSVATLKAAIDNVLEATVVKTQTLDAVVQLLHKCVAHDDNDGPTTVASFVLANLPELQPVLCQIESLHVEKTETTARVRELVEELHTRDQEQEQLQLEVDAQRATIAALQHAKDMMETNSAVSIQDLEATKAQWKESDILHQATIKTLTADYDKVACREKLVREQLESLVQQCQSELDAMQANTIDDLEQKVACLEADIQRYATDLVQHEAAQAKTMAAMDKEQEGMQRLQRDLAMLRNQLSVAPSVLYHINHMHGAITAPWNSAVGRDRARIATMQSQLAAEVEVTALQLTLKGLDISYVVNSIQRLPQLAQRLAQLSVTINNTTVVRQCEWRGNNIQTAADLSAPSRGNDSLLGRIEASHVNETTKSEATALASNINSESANQLASHALNGLYGRTAVVDEVVTSALRQYDGDEEVPSNPDNFDDDYDESVASMEASVDNDRLGIQSSGDGRRSPCTSSKDGHESVDIRSDLAPMTLTDTSAYWQLDQRVLAQHHEEDSHAKVPNAGNLQTESIAVKQAISESQPNAEDVATSKQHENGDDDGNEDEVGSSAHDDGDEGQQSRASMDVSMDDMIASSTILESSNERRAERVEDDDAHVLGSYEGNMGNSVEALQVKGGQNRPPIGIEKELQAIHGATTLHATEAMAPGDGPMSARAASPHNSGGDIESNPNDDQVGDDSVAGSVESERPSPHRMDTSWPASSTPPSMHGVDQVEDVFESTNRKVDTVPVLNQSAPSSLFENDATLSSLSSASSAPAPALPPLALRHNFDDDVDLDIVRGLMLEQMQQHSADQHIGQDDSFDDSFDAPASPVHGSSSRHDDDSVEQHSDGEEALSEAFGRDKVAVPPEPFHGRGAPDDTTESVEMSRLPRENIIVSHCEVVDQVQLSAGEQDDGSYVDEMDESLNESSLDQSTETLKPRLGHEVSPQHPPHLGRHDSQERTESNDQAIHKLHLSTGSKDGSVDQLIQDKPRAANDTDAMRGQNDSEDNSGEVLLSDGESEASMDASIDEVSPRRVGAMTKVHNDTPGAAITFQVSPIESSDNNIGTPLATTSQLLPISGTATAPTSSAQERPALPSQTNDTDVAGVDVKVQSRHPSDAKEFLDSHEVSFDDSKDDRAIVSKVQTVHGDEGDDLTSDDKDMSGDVNQDLDVSQSMPIQPIFHAVEGTGPELGHGEFFTGTDEAKAKAAVVSKLKADATDLEDVERLLTEQSQTATATSKDTTGFDNSFDASFDDDAGHDDETHQSEDEDLSDFEDGDHVGGEVYEIDTKATHVGGQGGVPLKSLLGDSGHVAAELQIAATTLLEPNAPLGGSVHHHDSGEEVDSDVDECDEDMEQSGEESRSRELESPPRPTSSSDSHPVALHEAGRFVQGSVELHSTRAINGKPSRLHADDADLDDVARLMVEQGQLGTARQSKTRGVSLDPLDDGELSGPDEDDGSVATEASERGEEFASHPVDPSAVGRADSAAIATRNDHSIHSLSSAVVDTFHSNHVTTSDHSPLSGDSDELGSSTQSILSCREVRLSAQSIPSFGFNQPGQHTKPNITLSGDALSIHVPSPVDDKDGDILQDSFSDQDESVDLSRGEDGILSGENDSSLHTSSPLEAADLNQGGKIPTSLHGEAPLDSLRSQTFSFQTGLSSRDVDTDEVERRMMDKTQYSARAFGDASELKGSARDDDVASADEELSDPDDDGESPDTFGTNDVAGGKALVTQKAGDHARVLSHNSTQSGPVDPLSSANAMVSLGLDDHSDDDDNDDEDGHHVMLDNTSDNTGHGVTASRAHQFGLSLNDQNDLDALSDDDDVVDSSPDGRDPTQVGVGERVEDRAITASDVHRAETDEIQRDNLPSIIVEPSKELSPGKSPPRLSPKLAPLDKVSWRGLPRIASDLAHLEHLTLNGSPPLTSVPGRDDDDFDEVSGPDDSVEGSVDDNSHENDHEERNQNDVNEDGNDDDALPSFGDAVPPHPSVVALSTAGLQYVATSGMLLPHDNDGLENSLDLEHSFDASDDDMDDVTQHSMDNVSDGEEIHHGAAQVDLPSRRYDAALDVSSDGDAMERSRDDSSADDTSPSKPMSISLSQRLIQAKLRTLEPKPDLTQRIEYTEHDSPSCSVEGSMELSHELEPVDATSDDENEDRDDESENDVVTQTPRTSVDSNLRDQTLVPTAIPSTIPTRHAHDDDDAEAEELMRGHISGSTVKQAYGVTGMTHVVSSGMTSSSPWMQNASTLSTQPQRDPYSAVNGRDDLEDSNDDYESYVTQAKSGNKIVSSDLATSHVNNEGDEMEALMHENLSTIAFKAHGTQGAASPSISLGHASSISQDGVKNNDKTLSHDLSHDGNVPTGHVRTTTPSTTSHKSHDEDEVEALMRGHIPTPAAKAQRTMGTLEAAQSLPRDALTLPTSRQNTPYRNADEGVDLDESQDDLASDHASDDSGPSPLKKLPNGNAAMPTGKRPLSALRSLPESKLSPLQPLSKLPLPSVVSSLGRRNFDDDESLDNDEQPLGPKVIIHSNFDDDEDEFGASASDHSIVAANQSTEAADNLSPPQSPHAITTTPPGHDVQSFEGTVSPQFELRRTTPSSPPTSPIPQTKAHVTSDRVSTATTAAPSSPPRSPSRRHGTTDDDDDGAYSDSFEFEESVASDEETS